MRRVPTFHTQKPFQGVRSLSKVTLDDFLALRVDQKENLFRWHRHDAWQRLYATGTDDGASAVSCLSLLERVDVPVAWDAAWWRGLPRHHRALLARLYLGWRDGDVESQQSLEAPLFPENGDGVLESAVLRAYYEKHPSVFLGAEEAPRTLPCLLPPASENMQIRFGDDKKKRSKEPKEPPPPNATQREKRPNSDDSSLVGMPAKIQKAVVAHSSTSRPDREKFGDWTCSACKLVHYNTKKSIFQNRQKLCKKYHAPETKSQGKPCSSYFDAEQPDEDPGEKIASDDCDPTHDDDFFEGLDDLSL